MRYCAQHNFRVLHADASSTSVGVAIRPYKVEALTGPRQYIAADPMWVLTVAYRGWV